MIDIGKWRIELDQFDLRAMGSTFRICELTSIVLDGAKPRAVLGSAVVDGAVLQSAEYAFPFRGRLKLPPDWCMLAYVHHTPAGSWWQGTDLAPGTAMIIMPGGTSELMFKADTCWSTVLIPVSRLRRLSTHLTACAAELAIPRWVMFDTVGNELGEELQGCFGRLQRCVGSAYLSGIDVDELARIHLKAGMLSQRPAGMRVARARHAHFQMVRRVEDFMIRNLRVEITNHQLCGVASASERTLRYAIKELLGVAPNRYLLMLRLCEANRCLTAADPRRHTVKSIALSCGLWNLSRFAENYRDLFGELPNQTLARQQRSFVPQDDARWIGQAT